MNKTTKIIIAFVSIFICFLTNENSLADQLYITGNVNIPGDTGTSAFNDNNTSGTNDYGLKAETDNSGNALIVSVTGNITANNNNQYGVVALKNGKIQFQGDGGTFTARDNSNAPTEGENTNGRGIFASGANTEISFYNMNINTNNNVHGIILYGGGKMNFIGSGDGSNNIVSNYNARDDRTNGRGINAANAGSVITIQNMDITSSNNAIYGLFSEISDGTLGGVINIIGTPDGQRTLTAEYNGYRGILATAINSQVNVTDMNINISNNTSAGVVSNLGGKVTFTGIASGNNTLTVNSNRSSSGNAGHGLMTMGGTSSSIDIYNMSVEVKNNVYGIQVGEESSIGIYGITQGTNSLIASENKNTIGDIGYGLYTTGDKANLIIENMDITADKNFIGLYGINGGQITVTSSTSKTNTLSASNNTNDGNTSGKAADGNGIYAYGAGTLISITGMNIAANNNSARGVIVSSGAQLKIEGNTSGSNILSANGNKTAAASHGIFVSGNGTKADISNMTIYANGNGNQGILSNNQSSLNITGESAGTNWVYANDNIAGDGIYAGTDSFLNLKYMNIVSNNNGRYGLVADLRSEMDITGIATRNTMILNNNGSHAIYSHVDGSKLNVTHMDIYASNNDFAYIGSGSVLNFTNSSINILTNSKGFYYSSRSTVNFTDSVFQTAGNHLMDYAGSTGSAAIIATRSMLNGSANANMGSTSYINLTDSRWNILASSEIPSIQNINSVINLSSPRGAPGNTLTVKNYASNNGELFLKANLMGDTSQTDKLIIDNGTVTGTTTLTVMDIGSWGGQTANGIMVIEALNGTALGPDSFVLKNDILDTTAYEYRLFQGNLSGTDTQSFFLRSTGRLSNIARTIANMPGMHLNFIKTAFSSLKKRIGELRDNDLDGMDGLWVRSYAKRLRVNEHISSDMNIYGIEGGFDRLVSGCCNSSTYAGIMTGYQYTDKIRTVQGNGQIGRGHAKTPSLGAYVTWLNDARWFADFTVQHFWSNMDTISYGINGETVRYSPDRNFLAGNLQIGRQVFYKARDQAHYVLEPKVEIQYAQAKAKTFNTNTNYELRYGKTESLTTRVGVSLGYRKKIEKNSLIEPYIQAALLTEWKGKTDISYGGVNFNSDVSGTGIEVSIGMNANLKQKYSFYSEISYENGKIYDSVSASVGFRYNF